MNENKQIFSKIGFNYLLLALIPILFQIIFVNAISLIDFNLIKNTNIQILVSSLTNYILVLPIFIYLMRKIKSVTIDKNGIKITQLLKYICIAIVFMMIGNLVGNIITTFIGNMMTNDVINPIEQLIENSNIYINLLIISILAPIFEELFFRKLLIDRTIRYGAKLSILLSAFMFAIFHGNLSQFFYAFLLGGLFAYIYIETGKIIYPIVIHACVNFYGSVASLIFNSATTNIAQGANMANIADIGIIAIYMIVLIAALFIGLYEIFAKYNKIDLNDSKREVYLEKPLQTVFVNVGMICFILYHIVTILISLNITHI